MTQRSRLAALVLVSLALNVGYVSAFHGVLQLHGDAWAYDRLGFDVTEGKGFPTTGGVQPKREPGYPLFLAGIYAAAGHRPGAVRLVQAVLAGTLCLLVFAMARHLARAGAVPPGTPWVAAALTAAYPGFVFYSGELMRETLFTWLTVLAFVPLTAYVLERRVVHAAAFGVVVGVAALVDARLMFFPLFFAVADALAGREWRRSLRFAVVSFGLALLVVAPWTVRNWVVLHRFVLLTASPQKGFFLATSPEEFLEWDWEREPLKSLQWLPREERDVTLARLAVENLRKYPGAYVASSARRLVRLWTGSHSEVVPLLERSLAAAVAAHAWGYAAVKSLFVGINLAYVVGGVAGAVVCLRHGGMRWGLHLVAFVVYLSLMHSLLFATARYHLPAIPILIVLFAFLIASWAGAPRRAVAGA